MCDIASFAFYLLLTERFSSVVATGACGSGTSLLPQLFQEITLGRANKTFLPGASMCVHIQRKECAFPFPFPEEAVQGCVSKSQVCLGVFIQPG